MQNGNRTAEIERKTSETDIHLRLDLDGAGVYQVDTGVGFLDHMLSLWSRHGLFDLKLSADGDLHVDAHHTVEDVGICLGEAIKQALGNKKGITRYGFAVLPMDEALVLTAVDLSGRGYLACNLTLPAAKVGEFDTELVEEFLRALVNHGEFTLHVRQLAGRNTHHIIEAAFKALGRALRTAVDVDARQKGNLPSTKGML